MRSGINGAVSPKPATERDEEAEAAGGATTATPLALVLTADASNCGASAGLAISALRARRTGDIGDAAAGAGDPPAA